MVSRTPTSLATPGSARFSDPHAARLGVHATPEEIALFARAEVEHAASLRIIGCTPAFERFFGYEAGECLNQSPSMLFSAESYDAELSGLYDAWQAEKAHRCRLLLSDAAGVIHPIMLDSRPLPQPEGESGQCWKLVFYALQPEESGNAFQPHEVAQPGDFITLRQTEERLQLLRRLVTFPVGEEESDVRPALQQLATMMGQFFRVDFCLIQVMATEALIPDSRPGPYDGASPARPGPPASEYVGSYCSPAIEAVPDAETCRMFHAVVTAYLRQYPHQLFCLEDMTGNLTAMQPELRQLQHTMHVHAWGDSMLATGLWEGGKLRGFLLLVQSSGIRFWLQHERQLLADAGELLLPTLERILLKAGDNRKEQRLQSRQRAEKEQLKAALRAPLNVMQGHAELLAMQAFGPFSDERYVQSVVMLRQALQAMQSYLDYATDARLGQQIGGLLQEVIVSPHALLEASLAMFRWQQGEPENHEHGDFLEVRFSGKLRVDKGLLVQLIAGLLCTSIRMLVGKGDISMQMEAHAQEGACLTITVLPGHLASAAVEPHWQWQEELKEEGRLHPEMLFMLKCLALMMQAHQGSMGFALAGEGGIAVKLAFPPERVLAAT